MEIGNVINRGDQLRRMDGLDGSGEVGPSDKKSDIAPCLKWLQRIDI